MLAVRLAGCEAKAASAPLAEGLESVPAYARPAVSYALSQGWISKDHPVLSEASAVVTSESWFTLLLKTMGYGAEADFVPAQADVYAYRLGISSRLPGRVLSRGDLFRSMKDALQAPLKNSTDTVLTRLIRSGAVSSALADQLGLQSEVFTARDIADRYTAAIVQLEMYRNDMFYKEGMPNAHASAFFISSDGIAVTNYHSIRGQSIGEAVTLDGQHFAITNVLFYDEGRDIAVIRISTVSVDGTEKATFCALPLVSSEDLCAGDEVFTLGNPLGLGLAVSSGIISAVNRVVANYDVPLIMNTADISTGSSGGALINIYGHVVGVTTGAYNSGNSLYLAVPIDTILHVDLSGEGQTLQEVYDIYVAAKKAAAAAADE